MAVRRGMPPSSRLAGSSVEWRDDSVYLTGWAEVLFEGDWLR
jgi:hypothetical protein